MLRILLIEDSDTDAFILQRAIRDHIKDCECMHVSTAAEGKEALMKQDDGIDVILLDLGLPDTTGPAHTYEQVKSWADKIPIVVITGLHDHTLAKSLVQGGAEDYLSKDLLSTRPSHVRDAIEFAIQRHSTYKKLASDKEDALQQSKEKDAILDCFMGGYSVNGTKPVDPPQQ